jgi:hypothetical protein
MTHRTMTLYRPVGLKEATLIHASRYTAFPPRLPEQPIFYPVLNYTYAETIARDWNTVDARSAYMGIVTRFAVDADYAARFPTQIVGARDVHQELWVPAEDLEEFNRHIVGAIEFVAIFYGQEYAGSALPFP